MSEGMGEDRWAGIVREVLAEAGPFRVDVGIDLATLGTEYLLRPCDGTWRVYETAHGASKPHLQSGTDGEDVVFACGVRAVGAYRVPSACEDAIVGGLGFPVVVGCPIVQATERDELGPTVPPNACRMCVREQAEVERKWFESTMATDLVNHVVYQLKTEFQVPPAFRLSRQGYRTLRGRFEP